MGLPPWEVGGMEHHTSPLLPPRGEPSSQERAGEASSALNGSVLPLRVGFRRSLNLIDKYMSGLADPLKIVDQQYFA